MGTSGLHDELAAALDGAVGADGGVAWVDGGEPEPEPTALAALALDDDRCRAWLLDHQDADGGFALPGGSFENVAPTGLAALALEPGAARERAIDRAVADRSSRLEHLGDYPLAWGWTTTTYSWVEPTARILLALRVLRPGAVEAIDEAVASLEEREVDGGGWNYGNADVLGTDLKPYGQTTASAVLGLAGTDHPMVERGIEVLRSLAVAEPGGLTTATAIVALRAAGAGGTDALLEQLADGWSTTRFLGDRGALAWAVLAARPGPTGLEAGA